MVFFLWNQSSIRRFLKSCQATTALSYCFWSRCKRLTAARLIKNNLMIAPCSCFFDTLYTQWANSNSAVPPVVQTALSAGNVLIRLCRSHSHHKHVSQQQAKFTNLLSVPAVLVLLQLPTPISIWNKTSFLAGTAKSYKKTTNQNTSKPTRKTELILC